MIKVSDQIRNLKAGRLVSIAAVKTGDNLKLYYHFSRDNEKEIGEFIIDATEDVESILPLYPNALIFEAEITEFYGTKFIGNELSGKRVFKGD